MSVVFQYCKSIIHKLFFTSTLTTENWGLCSYRIDHLPSPFKEKFSWMSCESNFSLLICSFRMTNLTGEDAIHSIALANEKKLYREAIGKWPFHPHSELNSSAQQSSTRESHRKD